jgi:hypothetical protein
MSSTITAFFLSCLPDPDTGTGIARRLMSHDTGAVYQLYLRPLRFFTVIFFWLLRS